MSLRDRITDFWNGCLCDSSFSRSSFVEDMESFIIAEIGRKADYRLESSLPLCMYFSTPVERDEFIAAVREAKPGMVSKSWPV